MNEQQSSSLAESLAFCTLAQSAEVLGDEAFLSTRQEVSDDGAPLVLDASWGQWPVGDHKKQHEVVLHIVQHQKGLGSSRLLTIPADPSARALYFRKLPPSSPTWVWLSFR